MKKIIALTFVFLMVLSAVPAFAAEPGGTYGQLKYSIADGKVTITGTTDTTDDHDSVIDVVIPDTIDDLPVVAIGNNAFYRCAAMKSVKLPATLEKIGDFAFCFCGALEAVEIPEGVKFIGEGAFGECRSIKEIALPGGLGALGDRAFLGCSSLEKATVPAFVENLGCNIFESCAALTDVYYEGNPSGWSDCAGLYIGDENVNVHYGIPFNDVQPGKWYTEGVLYCAEKGFMNGTGEATFSPDGSFTRAMFVQVLAKIDRADLSDYTGTSFSDVDESRWYAKATKWAYMMGYASGTGSGRFSPNAAVTRETLAQFLYNYSKRQGFDVSVTSKLAGYTDTSDISGWARNAVEWAVGNNLISGTTASTISPKKSATRAQVALILKNYYLGIYTSGSILTKNGMRAEAGAYISKIPENDQEKVTGGAYFRLFKPADCEISFENISIKVDAKLNNGLSISSDLVYNGVQYESGDEVYAEFKREVTGSIASAMFKPGDVIDVTITVTFNGKSAVLLYSVPIVEEVLVK